MLPIAVLRFQPRLVRFEAQLKAPRPAAGTVCDPVHVKPHPGKRQLPFKHSPHRQRLCRFRCQSSRLNRHA